MSLRIRLVLLSTVVTAVLFGVFGTVVFTLLRQSLYQPIDDLLEAEASSTRYQIILEQPPDLSEIGNPDPLSGVFYTFYTANGELWQNSGRPIPVSDRLVSAALEGETVWDYVVSGDGHRLRVLLTPLYYRVNGQIAGVLQVSTPVDIIDRRLSDLTWLLAGASGVLLVVAALGSYLLTGRALNAVDRVTRQVQQIEFSRDLAQRLPQPGTEDEIGHLVSTFNQLIERLQSALETQRRFVADSSHELRTPLTVIKSNIHLLRRSADPAEQAELLEATEAEISRLNRMVNNLLYMAQMEAGLDLKPVLRPVELDSLLLEVFARARSMASMKNQKVLLAHEDIGITMGDRDQLQHLLLNLVDNAIKYTPEGGTVSLGLWPEGDWLRLEVTDSGPGIPEAELPHIFERFYRTQEARKSAHHGSGLGLAIARSITEGHGGRIEVFSRVGEGTTFRLWLRKPPTQPAVERQPSTGTLLTRTVDARAGS
ncbi:MAG: two-component system, OmpR family, sensor kinase [Chloroflexia bacterium]|jgi:signal transduction histidine kinase|nr:two-component system, OmpR family, sensor kinase [Chloroflexia bacterium]